MHSDRTGQVLNILSPAGNPIGLLRSLNVAGVRRMYWGRSESGPAVVHLARRLSRWYAGGRGRPATCGPSPGQQRQTALGDTPPPPPPGTETGRLSNGSWPVGYKQQLHGEQNAYMV